MEEQATQEQQIKNRNQVNPSAYKKYKLEKIQSVAFKKEDYDLGMEEKTEIEDQKKTVHGSAQNVVTQSFSQTNILQAENSETSLQIASSDLKLDKKSEKQEKIQKTNSFNDFQNVQNEQSNENDQSFSKNEANDQNVQVITIQNNNIQKFEIEQFNSDSDSLEFPSDSEDFSVNNKKFVKKDFGSMKVGPRRYPAHFAVYEQDFTSLSVFTTTKLNEKDAKGNTPLMLAIKLCGKKPHYLKIVNKLLMLGADPSIKDNFG